MMAEWTHDMLKLDVTHSPPATLQSKINQYLHES
jgi:hypothetical protein